MRLDDAARPGPGRRDDALIGMVEEQIEVLTNRLAGRHTVSELISEAASLSSLIETLGLRAEFVRRLLDGNSQAARPDSQQTSVRVTQQELESFRREMLATSNDLIRRAAALIAKVHQRINGGDGKAAYSSLGESR